MLHQHSTSKSELNLDSADHKEIDSFITSPSLYTVISAYNNQLFLNVSISMYLTFLAIHFPIFLFK